MKKHAVETFTGDLDQVTAIQKTFLTGPDFVYFRKGEFANILRVTWEDLKLIAEAVDVAVPIVTAAAVVSLATVRTLWGRIKGQHKETTVVRRFLYCPDTVEVEGAGEILQEIGWSAKQIPAQQRGRLRYFVTGNRYCLFFRNPNDTFHGFIGGDADTIACLKGLFESEWNDA